MDAVAIDTPPKKQRLERCVAAVVLAVPLLYLLTERTREVFVVTWSKPWTVAVLVAIALYTAFLLSYARVLPRWLTALRSLVVVLLASTLAALITIEIVLRATDDAEFAELDNSGRHAPDPDVGHVYFPNHTQVLQSREYRAEWRSNSEGVRSDRDFGPKLPGTLRIVCVGDSFTACDQVPYRESWPAVLEECLAPQLAPARVEVVNAGFPGYATVNEAGWIAKFAGAFEPDVVLVAMTPNDLLENQFPLQYTARDGAIVSNLSTDGDKAHWQQHARWWCLAGVVERSLLAAKVQRAPAFKRLLGKPATNHVEAYMQTPNEKATRLYALTEKYLLEARDNATALGAKFGVVVIPYSHQLHPLGPGLDPTLFGRHWESFGAKQGFPVVDGLTAFLAHPEPLSLHWKEDTHCNAAGYALVGREVCKLVLGHRAEFGIAGSGR